MTLSVCREGASTASLGILFQYFSAFTVKNFPHVSIDSYPSYCQKSTSSPLQPAAEPQGPLERAGREKAFPASPALWRHLISLRERKQSIPSSSPPQDGSSPGDCLRGSSAELLLAALTLSPRSNPQKASPPTLHNSPARCGDGAVSVCVRCTRGCVVFSQLTHVRICLSLALCSNVTLPEFITSHLLIN